MPQQMIKLKDSFCEAQEHVFNKFPKYYMYIQLGDFNAKIGEDIFKPTSGNDSVHEIRNNNGVRLVNFPTSKNLTVRSTMFSHFNIQKFTLISHDGKTHNQIDHILIDRRYHSSVLISDHSRDQIIIRITIWQWQMLGGGWPGSEYRNNIHVSYGDVQSQ
jgi:hypothetical protein